LRHSVGDEFLSVGNSAHVALESHGFSPQLPNSRCHFLGAPLIRAVAKRHVRTFLGEALRDSQPDALASASDCRHFSIQPVCHDGLLAMRSGV
jgi:hypothetical protein